MFPGSLLRYNEKVNADVFRLLHLSTRVFPVSLRHSGHIAENERIKSEPQRQRQKRNSARCINPHITRAQTSKH